jgi:23S rRNA (adenine-N6)-dimethyltransferase
MYKLRRRLYSQNFLRNPELVTKLIRNSSIGPKDLVLEIGPGNGTITGELIKVSGRVIAVEIDEKLTSYLNSKFRFASNLEIFNSDFINFNLPNYPYKVFANIPFKITADIIRKLTEDINFWEGYLVVQKEAAKKFVGKPYDDKNSMMTVLLKPWFDIRVYHTFSRHDFIPFPNVDSVMIRIQRLQVPVLPYFEQDIYKDFIMYTFNREKVAVLDFDEILNKYNNFMRTCSDKEKMSIRHKAREIQSAQQNIVKIHRTRNDKNWRKF